MDARTRLPACIYYGYIGDTNCHVGVTNLVTTWCEGKSTCHLMVYSVLIGVADQCEYTYEYMTIISASDGSQLYLYAPLRNQSPDNTNTVYVE